MEMVITKGINRQGQCNDGAGKMRFCASYGAPFCEGTCSFPKEKDAKPSGLLSFLKALACLIVR